MLTNPSSRLGPSLVSLKVQLPCAPRCAVTPTPLLSHRRVQPTNLKAFHPTLSLSLRRQSPTNKARCASSLQLVRLASTSASSPAPAPTTTSAAQPSTTVTWNDYLALRKTRRRYNLAASFLTSVGTTSVGVTVMSQQNFEHLGGLFGLDPFIVLGLATAGSGALGWLLGPFVGNAVFGMVHRRVGGQIAEVGRRLSSYMLYLGANSSWTERSHIE